MQPKNAWALDPASTDASSHAAVRDFCRVVIDKLDNEEPRLRHALTAMAQLGLYSFGAAAALSVEAEEIAEAARTLGQPQLAQRAEHMSKAAGQLGRNIHYLSARGIVPTVNSAAVGGALLSECHPRTR